MYTCQPYVDSHAMVRQLPTSMYAMANVVSPHPTQAAATSVAATAATAIDIYRLERLRGDLCTLARVRGLRGTAAAASSVASAASGKKAAAAASASTTATDASAAASAPTALALHCSPRRPPLSILLLVELLRRGNGSKACPGLRVFVSSRARVVGGGGPAANASVVPPGVARLVARLVSANPPCRMAADLCLDLVWSSTASSLSPGDECSVIGNSFAGQPLLGESLALRAVNLAAGPAAALPEAAQLLDLADQLQTGRRLSEQRLSEQLLADPAMLSLGQLLAWSVLLLTQPQLQAAAGAAAKFSARLSSTEPFASFAGVLATAS